MIKVEPYWNVKKINEAVNKILKSIKVEPYWNVKNSETELVEFLKEN